MLTENVTKKEMISNLRHVIDLIEADAAHVRMRAECEPTIIKFTKISDPIPAPTRFILTVEVETI